MSLFDELIRQEEEESRKVVTARKPAPPMPAQKPAAAQGPSPAQKPAPMQARVKSDMQSTLKSSLTLEGESLEGKPLETHGHPAQKSPGTKTEKVDYIGYGTEGCEEHYNERYTAASADAIDISAMDRAQIVNALVLGEVLGTPRFRSPWRRK